jgi:hypothetical protein
MKLIMSLMVIVSKLVFKAMLIVVVLVMVVPPAYFAWRASQPMALQQFKGLSYYQLVSQRRQAFEKLAQNYQSRHPGRDVNYLTCFLPDTAVQLIGALPMAGFYSLAGLQPELKAYVNPSDLKNGIVPQNATWLEFLPAWWDTFEKLVWGMIAHSPHGPVAYCRISIP